MRDNGKMIKLMEKEYTTKKMEENMKENGLKTSNMDMVLKPFLMAQNTKDIF